MYRRDSYTYTDANGMMVYLEDRYYMELVKEDREMVAILDDNHAFCRRVPAPRNAERQPQPAQEPQP